MSTVFKAYRYQLLPLDRNETKDLYLDHSPQEIIARKNEFFADTLLHLPKLKLKNDVLTVFVKDLGNELFKLQLAPSRPLLRETSEFKQELIENWPHIEAFILNSKNEQLLLIQERSNAFSNTDTVAKIIVRGTRVSLERIGLSLHIEPLFEESYFWTLIERYKNKITWVEFEFITPNMANISKTLAETLKSLGKETNAVKEQLTLRSDTSSSLDISTKNKTIKGLVEYTSHGTGNIKLKIKGIRKSFQTSSSRREVFLSGIELTAEPHQIAQIIKDALK